MTKKPAKAATKKVAAPEAVPPTEGTLPAAFVPAHPVEPDATGSAPFSPSTPAGPMDEDVIHVTDDIAPDGTPLVQQGKEAVPVPDWDGESDRFYSDVTDSQKRVAAAEKAKQATPVDPDAEPLVNQHSEEGARLDEKKLGRPVVYVPNEATLDPVANDPSRAKG